MRLARWLFLLCLGPLALSQHTAFKGEALPSPHEQLRKKCVASSPSPVQDQGPMNRMSGISSVAPAPWVEQVTGLPADLVVYGLHAVDTNTVWAVPSKGVPIQSYTRTTNGGTTWMCDTIHSAPSTYCCRSVFAFDASTAWIAMHDHNTTSGGGIFATTDGGATWKQDTTAFKTPNGWADFIYFFDTNSGVCVGDPTNGYYEIYTTSDAGKTWLRVPQANIPPPLSGEFAIEREFTASGNSLWFPVYVSASGGGRRFYKTTDKGMSWSVLEFPLWGGSGWLPTLEFQNENVGLGQNSSDGIMKSTDGGVSWTLLPNTSWIALNHQEYVPHTAGMYVATGIDLGRSQVIAPVSYSFFSFFTLDGGATWTRAGEFSNQPDLSFASQNYGWRVKESSPNIYRWTIPSGRIIAGCPGSCIFDTVEVGKSGRTIAVDVTNYGRDPFSVSQISIPGPNFTVTGQPTLPATLPSLQTLRFSVTFTPQENGMLLDSVKIVSNASNEANMFVRLQGRGVIVQSAAPGKLYGAATVLLSLDMATGTPAMIGLLGGTTLHGLTIRPSTGELYGTSASASTTGVYRVCCGSAITVLSKTFPVGNMRAIAFSRNGELYGASRNGRLYRLNLTTGDTIGIGTAPGVVYGSIAFSPSGRLWASVIPSTSGKDRIYTVNTVTGEATLVGSTGDSTYTPSIFFTPNGALYGLKGTGVQTNTVISIDTLTGAGTLLFSTGMTGITALTMFSIGAVGVEVSNVMPEVCALEQSYPNPFNPSATIRYQLAAISSVRLTVYDLLGREVAVLVNEKRGPGSYEVKFDASGLASGVYIYRLTAGSFVETRKMLLLQ
jgi:photosystem II stability/assembly factor-like uncharacterized protein